MLEDQVAFLLQKFLGNYVRGLSKEALKISVWRGDVELTNMQLKPEALNALKLPVKVKAGFLGSVKLKVPWNRLGQEPVLVSLDRIFLLAEPATQVEGQSEDAVQEAKKSRVREIERKLLEKSQEAKLEMNTSWLGSLINTIIGNLKLSISNIHIRYEDPESNPGHPFAAGITLEKLSAVTVDDNGMETFATGGALDRIQKSVKLGELAVYLDSDIIPWHIDKPWEDLLPSEWVQIFRFGTKDGKPANQTRKKHSYILQPVTGNAKYSKLLKDKRVNSSSPLQKAAVNLDDVTLCLPKDGYRDILKLADNFAAFNQRLKYAHFRPLVSVKSAPRAWWKYAYKAVSDQIKKASGKLSWEQVVRYASLRKRYVSLYASLLKSDVSRTIVDDNKEIVDLDRELDIDLIVQWRMLSHKFVEQSMEFDSRQAKQKAGTWWSFGWGSQSSKDEDDQFHFTDEDWEQLNKLIGFKETEDGQSPVAKENADRLDTSLEILMNRNATKLVDGAQELLAELSCDGLSCAINLYPETKVFDLKLGSYQLSSPNGLIAESATSVDSLVGSFHYKPFDAKVDWSMAVKASPCYMTYLKDPIEEMMNFFENNDAVSHTVALETAAAVQMTIDEVKRTAQQQVNRALKDHTRFQLDLDIAAPKITIPTDFRPDGNNSTKLLLDLGNLVIRSQDEYARSYPKDLDMYLQFDLVLRDVSAFLVDGDYRWGKTSTDISAGSAPSTAVTCLPVLDKCGISLRLQQIRLENPSYPSLRIATRMPSLVFHFSPARYHRLMQVGKIFQQEIESSDHVHPWNQADFEGWLSLLIRKGMGNREAMWQRRYLYLVGPFLYILESPGSKSYKQYLSLKGKQIYQLQAELVGCVDHVLAICDAGYPVHKVVENMSAIIIRCDSDDSLRHWQSRFQGAIYRASVSAPITTLSETSSDSGDSETEPDKQLNATEGLKMEHVYLTGVLDELKIRFNYSHQRERSFLKILKAEENSLFEFRALGGQVELSLRNNDLFLGTLVKSLEIEDLVCRNSVSRPCFLARSFVHSADGHAFSECSANQSPDNCNSTPSEGEDRFYEVAENLADNDDLVSPNSAQSKISLVKPPSFSRIAGLLPSDVSEVSNGDLERIHTLDSFVKAQITIYDQNSSLYNNIDTEVKLTLATLSFFCRRPTVLAIMEFVSAINADNEADESIGHASSAAFIENDRFTENLADDEMYGTQEPVVKGLLGKGKSRVIFNLVLNMARAEILLMNENETKLATLSQNNLLADIKVFPSSFSIVAALGNLRISDDSLPSSHSYFWICDMRNPGGSSFVELMFTSFSADDEGYEGYEYSLIGKLSEVRFIYLNRFVQEVASYFMGLVPENSSSIVKLKDQVTNSEKWFMTSEIEGSPALKLDLSLRNPIILMPRRTDSADYLKLDVVHITVKNTFQWLHGDKSDMNAVHLEILTVQVEDINLNVGTGTELGESIIRDVNGVSIVIWRSLRDLLHHMPSIEATVKIDKLKATLSNKEYLIISECALSNISETPHTVPQLRTDSSAFADRVVEPVANESAGNEPPNANEGAWVSMKVGIMINLVELSLHSGRSRDASLATIQATGAWLLYKSNNLGEGFLSATLKGFSVIDDREGTEEEFRLAIGRPKKIGYGYTPTSQNPGNKTVADADPVQEREIKPVPTMLMLDAKFSQSTTFVSLCVQRPQLLVALDFLLAVVEFFVPAIAGTLSNDDAIEVDDAVVVTEPVYKQPSAEISFSPLRPLIVDGEALDHFIYDGEGGTLHLKDKLGFNLSAPSKAPTIYVGDGKKLQFRNVVIKNGQYLDSCILLGCNSSYSASEDDQVYLEGADSTPSADLPMNSHDGSPSQDNLAERAMEVIVELQAIGPELTFYSASKNLGVSSILSSKLLHAQLDVFSRIVMKGDTVDMTANALGLMVESKAIRILEPFDTFIKYSKASGKTNIHVSVSDIFMNFTFSVLKLFLAVEDDILAFLRTTSKEMTVSCSEFDKVGMFQHSSNDQMYVFWRPRAPPGFAVLGDYLTPLDKPPTKGVLAVNTNLVRVKRPISFELIWSSSASSEVANQELTSPKVLSPGVPSTKDSCCSIWFPEAPKGYVALGCVASADRMPPALSSVFCILASLVSPCPLRDCVAISSTNGRAPSLAFWRVKNSFGTFLPADPMSLSLIGRAYELRSEKYGYSKLSGNALKNSVVQGSSPGCSNTVNPEQSIAGNSDRRFQEVASFQPLWSNRLANSRKKVSIWRPVLPQGMVYFGDIAVNGYEPPNRCVVLHNIGDEEILKAPLDYHLVGQIKKHRGVDSVNFWMPQAPPGFVSLGCVACKGSPKQNDFSKLRCLRSDMVVGDQFLEESLWDTSDTRSTTEPFSVWAIGNESGTFIIRNGFKKPPRRFALKLADNPQSGSDDTVIDAEIGTLSAAIFDDYGGLMVPLCNVSLSGVVIGSHGRAEYSNSTASFSLAARSYNDKYEAWEPLIEPVDVFLRYQYDGNALGAASQLRLTSTRDLNVNISVSNTNMIIQAYASWNNLSSIHEQCSNPEAFSPAHTATSIIAVHHKRNFFIIPQNKLGKDIFIRTTENRGLSNSLRMPSGDMKPVKVPVSKNMLDSHLKGKRCLKIKAMVTVIIADAQLPGFEGLSSNMYTVAIRLRPNGGIGSDSEPHKQSVRTSGSIPADGTSEFESVTWNEIFFFKVDATENYMLELLVTNIGKGDPVGFFSSPLNQITRSIEGSFRKYDYLDYLAWIELFSAKTMATGRGYEPGKLSGKLRCAVFSSSLSEVDSRDNFPKLGQKSGYIQISPNDEGPWTTVRLNYAAPAACWRLGNDVVASEVNVKDGNRYVTIRSLVSVRNDTDFLLEVRLVSKSFYETVRSQEASSSGALQIGGDGIQVEEYFETEAYDPANGWVSCSSRSGNGWARPEVELPSDWEWTDDWHLDTSPVSNSDGWVYSPDIKSLRWPESFDKLNSTNHARQRRWIRNRRQVSRDLTPEISVGLLKHGETLPVPLQGVTQSSMYILQLRPSNLGSLSDYSWSSVVDTSNQVEDSCGPRASTQLCLSSLVESEELLSCTQVTGTSSGSSPSCWFSVSIQATEIAKDIRSDPIQDWSLVVKSPLSISNYLPLAAEYSVLDRRADGHFVACERGIFSPGKTVRVHTADIRNHLFLSLLPQKGWLPINEAILISQPQGVPSRTMTLRSSISGRVVQLLVEQNYDHERPLMAKTIRVSAPYWFSISRCPGITCRLVDLAGKKQNRKITLPFKARKSSDTILGEISEDEINEGYTIASALNFSVMGLSVSITESGEEPHFGPIEDLSPLSNLDGSLDIYANDADGNCMQLFVSTKPSPYQSVPTKVISIRPFITFTNRVGEDILIRLNAQDEPKVLRAYDSRVSFVHRRVAGSNKLQVQLGNTQWSYPVEIAKEDTVFLSLRGPNGARKFLSMEVRGFEEGSRFIVVFRLGPTNGPIRIENRTMGKTISVRQSGFAEDAWINVDPVSTTSFSWEDPYGEKWLDARVLNESRMDVWKLDLEGSEMPPAMDEERGLQFQVVEIGDIKVARFLDHKVGPSVEGSDVMVFPGNWGISYVKNDGQSNTAPVELIVEFGVVGISVVDLRPKELTYMYFERLFVSYSTGCDGGATSRFKLIVGYLQFDNQLPLTLMPVLLAPDQSANLHHPVFKMTVMVRNENTDGILVYPYIYIRVTEKVWRLNIHEPIIWALVDFYSNLQLNSLPQSSGATQVDPEIRLQLIDVSEVRLKVSLETAPSQRPHGVLGVWSPVLSAVGNAFKIQVHLRRVMRRDRFMRKSSIAPAIGKRIWRDLIHNPLHLLFSVDVLGMTSSTLASLSKGFAELSTDGQFMQLRSKQVRSRRITGVGDGIMQGTEALAQGFAFGVSGVLRKPVESARQNGVLGLAHGLGRAFLGFFVQPVSGALDFFSLTVDGIGASCSKCLEVLNNKTIHQRVRNPRAMHADFMLREYNEKEAVGQMVLYLAEASRQFGCTEIFKEPSKFALTDYYEDHFIVPYQRIVMVTNKRVMLLQCSSLDKMDKKASKILWDVPWEDLMALELAKAGYRQPSHLLLHLKNFRKPESFVRVIKCIVEDGNEETESQAVKICSVVRRIWKAYKSDMKSLVLKVPASQRRVYFAWSEGSGREPRNLNKPILKSRELYSASSSSDDLRFVGHTINFVRIWSSEQETRSQCKLCRKQVMEDSGICSIWRPSCPDGFVSVGDIAHVGIHPPNVAAVYRYVDGNFKPPVGYDLVWRNCEDDYKTPVSIWHPRAPEGFVAPGCVAVPGFEEPEANTVQCVAESLVEETEFEEQRIWSAPDSYPWACHIYQVKSDALHFVALRQRKEESDWKAMRVLDSANNYPSPNSHPSAENQPL